MRRIFSVAVIVGIVTWSIAQQRRLQAARMRGDMYRDVAARLDRQVVELPDAEPARDRDPDDDQQRRPEPPAAEKRFEHGLPL